MREISRRRFVTLTATGIAATPLALMARPIPGSPISGSVISGSANGAVTAQEVVDRIQKNLGAPWKPDTVDGFKAGDPSTVVTRIVTTSLASLDVLGRAVKTGANLIVTSEPTFFSRADTPAPPVRRRFTRGPKGQFVVLPPPPGPPPSDPVFTAKNDFIKKHNLVVFRFSDNWRLRPPDPFAQGLAGALGRAKDAGNADPGSVSIRETSLESLVMHLKKSLQSRGGMRVVGHPDLRVRKVGVLPGSTPIQASLQMLPNVDVIVAGEVREWESVEYVLDTIDLGGKKALILVGRIVSEEPGMQVCAQWLKTVVPELRATSISAGDPYWRPSNA